jgi:hypothetical protein
MPFKLACHCGFETESPTEFADHLVATQHLGAGMMPEGETGELAELVDVLATIQAQAAADVAGVDLELPEGVEINRLSPEDILADDTLTDQQKQEILGRFEAVMQRRGKMDS